MIALSPQAAFDEVLALDLHRCALTVALASSTKDAIVPCYERLQIAENLVGEFRQIVAYLISQLKREGDSGHLRLCTYSLQSKPDAHEVEWLSLAKHSDIANQLRPLASPATLDLFQGEAPFVAGLRFYSITLQPPAAPPVHFLRTYGQKKVLSRSRSFAVWLQDGAYDRVSSPIFLFDHHIDCVSAGNWLFVLKKDHTHKMFRTAQILRQSADQMLTTLRISIPIANFEGFARDCEYHPLKLAKLRSILSKPYLKQITMEQIQQVIATYSLPLEIVEVAGCQQLLYDPKQKWVILKLLDDDYLWSVMSDQRYEVSSKREI